MERTEPTWADVVNASALGYASGYDLGMTQGHAEGWEAAHRDQNNRQASRAGVQNIAVEIARAKADGRDPRLYQGRWSA